MTDKTIPDSDFNTKLFEQLLDEYTFDLPKPGQNLNGEVLRIEENAIFVDVGLKRDAMIPAHDLENLDPTIRNRIQVGDTVHVIVVHPGEGDQYLDVSLARGIEHEAWDQALKSQQENQILSLEVVGQNKGGLLVQFDSLRGFIPNSKIPEIINVHDRMRVDKIKHGLIGTKLPVKVIEIDPENNRLVFSAEAAIEEQRKKRLAELQVGEIVTGKVVTIVDFGVFIDLNGVDGLIHISELDWRRVNRPSDVLKLGDEVQAKVTEVDQARERISLSRKVLLPSPWEQFAEEHKTGEVLEGQITNVLEFGAFVELPGGIQGLVPTREIGYLSAGKPQDVVTQGERVLVKVMEIEPNKERITLSMRRVPMEAQISWMTNREEGAGRSESPEPSPLEGKDSVTEDEANNPPHQGSGEENIAEENESLKDNSSQVEDLGATQEGDEGIQG